MRLWNLRTRVLHVTAQSLKHCAVAKEYVEIENNTHLLNRVEAADKQRKAEEAVRYCEKNVLQRRAK